MEKRLMSRWLFFLYVLPFSFLTACHDAAVRSGSEEGYFLQMHVAAGQMKGSENGNGIEDEKSIRSIYVYAFDDSYPIYVRDYYSDDNVNGGLGVLGKYSFKMKIYGTGTKRFYVFVNPPLYVRDELVADCPEDRLKSLALYQYKPFFDVGSVQQTIDGSDGKVVPTGFPMSNFFEAELKAARSNPRNVLLFPLNSNILRPIDEIPLFRSLGKISVEAKLKEDAMPVVVSKIEIFNYTGDGRFLPAWQGIEYWMSGSQNSVWNTNLEMNLEKMAMNETRAFTDPFLLSFQPVPVESNISWKQLCFCYLCQNSYGRQKNPETGMQNGLDDVVGNRVTQLHIVLSDGRENTVQLPFICRNDHLKVKFLISRNTVQVYFEKWKELDVRPDWTDEVLPGGGN